MSAAHTPGPWRVDEDTRPGFSWNRHIYSGPNTAICFMAHSDGVAPEMDEANARLIAAAPDLLEALAYALKDMEQVQEVACNRLSISIGLARAAITKATGGAA